MPFKTKLIFISVSVAFSALLYNYVVNETPKMPDHIFKDHYWGRKVLKSNQPIPKDTTEIRSYTVHIEESVLQDLKERLQATRYVEPLPNANFTYGFNGNYLKNVIDYWLNSYNWRKEEQKLNKYNHFKTQIEGIDVHFVHVKPEESVKHIVPLLIAHGWPGSIVEYYKSIPLLTAVENDIAFELVIPSIPGYGFSEEPHQPGFGVVDTARVFNKLMERLGHKQYYFHGTDLGNGIGRFLSVMYPENVLGYHTTQSGIVKMNLFLASKLVLTYFIPSLLSDHPQEEANLTQPFMERVLYFMLRESGYIHIQATKPDTISVGILNSPAGLAAYILEKFSTETNRDYVNHSDGGLTKHFTYDELLTNIMLYWNTIHSSIRMYKEMFANLEFVEYLAVIKVPVGLSIPPHEILYFPKVVAKQAFRNLIHYNFMPRGGHFTAMEEPQLMATEIRTFVTKCIDFHKLTKH